MLMRNLMEYMLAKDLLSESCLLLPSRGYAQHIPQNLAYFACRLVDKLWQVCALIAFAFAILFYHIVLEGHFVHHSFGYRFDVFWVFFVNLDQSFEILGFLHPVQRVDALFDPFFYHS